MDEQPIREEFLTGMRKIRTEIKSRLVSHGLYGSVTDVATNPNEGPVRAIIELTVKGRCAARSFDHQQIEACCLRVHGPVLLGIIEMIDELA